MNIPPSVCPSPKERLAIVGSRTFSDYALLKKTLDEYKNISKIISGGARGADKLGEKWAKENNIETLIFLPDWNKYGRAAGVIRNRDIVSNSDTVIAFQDGKSTGTLSSINLAKKLKKNLKIILFSQ